jgi:hypothetical protein
LYHKEKNHDGTLMLSLGEEFYVEKKGKQLFLSHTGVLLGELFV